MEWIKPANLKYYDYQQAYLDYQEIYWHDRIHFEIGDTVYLYSTKPEGKITHACCVIEKNVPSATVKKRDDPKYYRDNMTVALEHTKYYNLKCIKTVDTDLLSLENLKKHGLPWDVRSTRKLPFSVVHYIESVFKKQ